MKAAANGHYHGGQTQGLSEFEVDFIQIDKLTDDGRPSYNLT